MENKDDDGDDDDDDDKERGHFSLWEGGISAKKEV
jgi:hypothetical protein